MLNVNETDMNSTTRHKSNMSTRSAEQLLKLVIDRLFENVHSS